jgi:hypothetical protein
MSIQDNQEVSDERSGLLSSNRYINYDQGDTESDETLSPSKQVQNNNGISWYFAVFLIVNAALGAGVLNFGKAYDNAGGIVISSIVQLVC